VELKTVLILNNRLREVMYGRGMFVNINYVILVLVRLVHLGKVRLS